MQIFTVLGMFMGSIRYFMKQLVGVERTVCQTGTEAEKDAGNSGQSGTVTVKPDVSKVLEIVESDDSYRFLILPKLITITGRFQLKHILQVFILTDIKIQIQVQTAKHLLEMFPKLKDNFHTLLPVIKLNSTISKERKNWKLNMENY